MKPRLLVVPEDDGVIHSLLPKLSQRADLRVEASPNFRSAILLCADQGPPTSILAKVDMKTPGLLELMIALDPVGGSVPCLALVDGGSGQEVPAETSPSLVFKDVNLPLEDLLSTAASMVAKGNRSEGLRKSVDYLLLSIFCHRSLSLDVKSDTGCDAYIEVVGGDIWNVYADDLEALPALESILYEQVAEISIRTLNTIPGERQFRLSGLQCLAPASRRLAPRPPVARPWPTGGDHGTQEIFPDSVRKDVREDTREVKLVDPSPPEPAPPEDPFDLLLAEGIEASLARDYQRAAKAFEAALEIRPNDPRSRFNLKRIRRYLGG